MSINPEVVITARNNLSSEESDLRSTFGALKVAPTEHERVHAGKMYTFSTVSSIANNATRSALFRISSDSNPIHLRDINILIGGLSEYKFYEAPFIDVNSLGTGMTARRVNRAITSYSTPNSFYDSPYFNTASAGTLLEWTSSVTSEGGAVKASENTIGTSMVEWVLAPGYDYLATFTNKSGSTQLFSGYFLFYDPS